MAFAVAGLLAFAWIWFLARGRTRGAVKRLGLRASLFALIAALVAVGARKGVFAEASFGFRVALLLALLTVAVGYLYLIRFCGSCGRMVRGLRDATCPRCGAYLPVHGMTPRLRRPGDDRRWDPLEKRQRPLPPRDDAPRA